jgi:SAM-dependent methyltransferase
VTNTGRSGPRPSRAAADLPTDVVWYGPDGPTDDDLRILGDAAGKRVLDLGCGAGQASIVLARKGATVIAVDSSDAMLEQARHLADRAKARVEWHHGDVAELAFLRAESIDLAVSVYALDEVDDLGRVLRQVHRVLKNRAPFVFSYEHPLALCVGREPPNSPSTPLHPVVRIPYFSEDPVRAERDGELIKLHVRTVSDVFQQVTRSGFRVEVLAEPRLGPDPLVPRTIIWRARKEGF